MNIFSFLTKKDRQNTDFENKYYILEVQLSYEYNNQPLIKLICTKILKREFDEREYIIESLYGEHVRHFFYPATEEYKDYFIMFSQSQRSIKFKEEDFIVKKTKSLNSNKSETIYVKKCIVSGNLTPSERLMRPL